MAGAGKSPSGPARIVYAKDDLRFNFIPWPDFSVKIIPEHECKTVMAQCLKMIDNNHKKFSFVDNDLGKQYILIQIDPFYSYLSLMDKFKTLYEKTRLC